MKFNNRTLLIVLVSLAGILFASRYFFSGNQNANLNMDFVQLDTSAVATIYLYPKAENFEEIKFTKSDSEWLLTKGNKTVKPQQDAAQNLLNSIVQIKGERLASKSAEKWNSFEVTDSLGTRVKVVNASGKVLLDVLIGKFSFKQAPQTNPYGGGGGGKGTTYVRLRDEKEVFAVDGFLTFSFNREFSSFRNQTFLQINKDALSKISWMYPDDGSFAAEKNEFGNWMINGNAVDSSSFDTYLNALVNMSNNQFADEFSSTEAAANKVLFEFNNGQEPVELSVWIGENPDEIIFKSSQNPESYFKGMRTSQYGQLLKLPVDFAFKQ